MFGIPVHGEFTIREHFLRVPGILVALRRARLVVIGQVPGQQARPSGFIHDDHVVETFPTN
jgi:hypothetical protein